MIDLGDILYGNILFAVSKKHIDLTSVGVEKSTDPVTYFVRRKAHLSSAVRE